MNDRESPLDFSRLASPTGATQTPAPLLSSIDPTSWEPITLSSTLTPTDQQQAFLQHLCYTTRNILLQARAGTGKTSAILMGVEAYLSHHPAAEVLVCAYNVAIKNEVADKLKDKGYDWKQVGCQTVHGMGMGLLKFTFRPEVDEKKTWKILNELGDQEPLSHPLNVYGPQIVQLVSYAKQAGVGFFPELHIEDRGVWYRLCDHYDLDGYDNTVDIDAVVTQALRIYKLSLDITQTIDFDDMVLYPLIKGLRVKYAKDLILGDEAQDWSRCRQALVKKFMRPRVGRLIVVGDSKQAIYGFSGADSAAMSNLSRDLQAVELPLSVTWRCPKQVVKLAQSIVPDIEAAEAAPEGEVLKQGDLVTGDEAAAAGRPAGYIFLDDLEPGKDVILCRNTSPLIPLAYRLIRSGIPAKVEGRKIGEGLAALVERWKVRGTAELINRLEDYQQREAEKFKLKGQDDKVLEVEDRVATLLEIIKEVNRRGRKDIQGVLEFIRSLFEDGARGVVTLATYHRSKGREWERVLLWEHYSRCPSKAARQAWQKEQESNLFYVAATRAKKTLVFVG